MRRETPPNPPPPPYNALVLRPRTARTARTDAHAIQWRENGGINGETLERSYTLEPWSWSPGAGDNRREKRYQRTPGNGKAPPPGAVGRAAAAARRHRHNPPTLERSTHGSRSPLYTHHSRRPGALQLHYMEGNQGSYPQNQQIHHQHDKPTKKRANIRAQQPPL